jgi:cyclopropane-fatty-acyl-phospholipid synthase
MRIDEERALLHRLLARVHRNTVLFRHEDGSVARFGKGSPEVVVQWSDRATRRTLTEGTLGFCGGYVDRDWSVVEGTLLGFMESMISARLHQPIKALVPLPLLTRLAVRRAWAQVTRRSSARSVRRHYEVDREFFRLWLDEDLVYTCGVARTESDGLEAMQRQKLELICRKLRMRPGMSLLDLGCGWGGLALHAAKHFRAPVAAVNVSRAQLSWLEKQAAERGASHLIRCIQSDARDVRGTYDRVAAVGVVEHLGRKGIGPLFRSISRSLRDGGLALVHTIGSSTTGGTDPWLEKTIFPGSYVPALSELVRAAERSGLRVGHVENLGPHYALTLRHWLRRYLEAAAAIEARFDSEFFRTWEMYLTMLIPTFECLSTGLYQLVLSKGEEAPAEVGIASFCGWRHENEIGYADESFDAGQ